MVTCHNVLQCPFVIASFPGDMFGFVQMDTLVNPIRNASKNVGHAVKSVPDGIGKVFNSRGVSLHIFLLGQLSAMEYSSNTQRPISSFFPPTQCLGYPCLWFSSSSSLPVPPASVQGSNEAPPPLSVTGQPLDGAPAWFMFFMSVSTVLCQVVFSQPHFRFSYGVQ